MHLYAVTIVARLLIQQYEEKTEEIPDSRPWENIDRWLGRHAMFY